ncbi:tRNA1(Val) (adenine(37)-N6)-methyltransferase [Methylobacterium radiodurans]|uniref:Methyltransferase n=1 Tax=Methylobacterium radiodurans TaxID=2202828 RepID=A0A2U8VYA4_9HYPH|nr:methyltransferase [Methylobacterium radiodurans]AWN38757.1 methyltransferase [Methylobacterium radiodurans]
MSAEPDSLFGGRLRLFQPARGAHRAGTDAVLLARLLDPGPEARVCDLGAGSGAVGLAYGLAGARVTLVEREPEMAALARRNALLNRIAATIVETDLLAPAASRQAAGLEPESQDAVVTNPPFFESGSRPAHRPSPNALRAAAHSFGPGDLDGWIRACAWILRPGGQLGLIHRADALPACLAALDRRFGGISVRPVHARADRPAIRVLIRALKGSRAPLDLLPPLVLQSANGAATPESAALHGGEPWPPVAHDRL